MDKDANIGELLPSDDEIQRRRFARLMVIVIVDCLTLTWFAPIDSIAHDLNAYIPYFLMFGMSNVAMLWCNQNFELMMVESEIVDRLERQRITILNARYPTTGFERLDLSVNYRIGDDGDVRWGRLTIRDGLLSLTDAWGRRVFPRSDAHGPHRPVDADHIPT